MQKIDCHEGEQDFRQLCAKTAVGRTGGQYTQLDWLQPLKTSLVPAWRLLGAY